MKDISPNPVLSPGANTHKPGFPVNLLDAGSGSVDAAESLVFVDGAVDNFEFFAQKFSTSEVILLDSDINGIQHITDVLKTRRSIDSVHFISHGKSGDLLLGNTRLNGDTLATYREQVKTWGEALTAEGDLFFYGCNLAADSQGLAFVQDISQLTGADLQASNDFTGHAGQGGDWVLEVTIGEIDSQLVPSAAALAAYQGLLADVPDDDLAMALSFNEGSGTAAFDTSPNGQNNAGSLMNGASFAGTVAIRDGITDGVVTLDGSDDYIAISNSSDINIGTFAERTISVWFQADNPGITSRKQVIFEAGGTSRGLNIYVENDRLYVGGWNENESNWNGTYLSTDLTAASGGANGWHHVGLVLDAQPGATSVQSDVFSAYLNGQEFGSSPGSGSQLWSHGDGIGFGAINGATQFHDGHSSGTGSQALAGRLADARLYNRALTAAEIAILADPASLASEELVMHLSLDETSGTPAADVSPDGQNNSGTLRNGATFEPVGGDLGGGVRFDGNDDYIAVADSTDINLRQQAKRTVTAWFKVDDATVGDRKQVIFEAGGIARGLNIYIYDGQLYVGGWNEPESNWTGTYLSTSDISSNTWHHVALVLDAQPGATSVQPGVLAAYLDGVEFGSKGNGSQLWNHGADIGIGAVNADTRFHDGGAGGTAVHGFGGTIADVRVYNQSLNSTRISTLAAASLPNPGTNNDPATGQENIVFPADANVVDVRAYGALPDDGIDDTAAIQQALDVNPSGNYIFYFANGVYDISDTLTLAGSEKRNIFQGQSESGTVLRLMDSVSSDFSGALINFGPAPAQRFRNSLRNMTISVGVNHPNAVGVQFNASNQGTVKDVTILSEDGQGAIGLDMNYTDEIGPLLVQGLTVDGFDYGIWTRWPTASQTFEDITLRNQNTYGWWNTSSQRVFARGVKSTNSVTAIRNEFEAGMVLVDSVLTGVGAASDVPAIYNQKSMYVRNVQTSGYDLALRNALNFGRGNPDVTTANIDEYLANGDGPNRSGGPFKLFDSPDRLLNLPVQDTPEIPWDTDFSNWSGPHLHVIGNSGIPDDLLDDTAAIQAAIDSGATTIYLPRGEWALDNPLVLRGNVVRFIGTEAILEAGPNGIIRVDGNAPTVVVERIEGLGMIEHASSQTLVLNNLLGLEYRPVIDNPGNVFINDSVSSSVTFRNQQVWARQLNLESDTQSIPSIEAKLFNDNSQVWVLGLKTEDEGTVVKTINGGSTEVLGSVHVGGGISNADNPRFETIDSSFSIGGIYGGGFSVMARETRNGETRTAPDFNLADAYVAYSQS